MGKVSEREKVEKAPGVKSSEWKISTILHGEESPRSATLPEYGGLGGTGGHSNLPTESEKDGAPSLTLSRLQLLGVGLTYCTQKHHKSLNRLWELHRTTRRTQWSHAQSGNKRMWMNLKQ